MPAANKPHIVIIAGGNETWLGGRQYALNLLQALIAARGQMDTYDVSVLARGERELAFFEPLRSKLRECADLYALMDGWTFDKRVRWKIKRTFFGWMNPQVEELLQRMGATFAYPISIAKIPSADWIPDFQYYNFPEAASVSDRAERKIEATRIVRDAQRIVLSSICAERDCHIIFPQTIGRTTVLRFRAFADPLWFAANPEKIRQKYNLPENFVLISNWLVPTKNHEFVLESLALVPDTERRAMHVVCTGPLYDYRNPDFYNQFLNKIHMLGMREQVSVLGVIPKADQIQLLRASTAYLQPSLHEGWNTGVEEAHLFGKAVLLSDIRVHREQDPPRATYFNPRDPSDLEAKLRQLFGLRSVSASTEGERVAVAAYGELQLQFARTFLSMAI